MKPYKVVHQLFFVTVFGIMGLLTSRTYAGTIVLLRNGNIIAVDDADGSRQRNLGPYPGRLQALESVSAARDGSVILFREKHSVHFVRIGTKAKQPKIASVACRQAQLSPDGRCVLCIGDQGDVTAVVPGRPPHRIPLGITARAVRWLGPSSREFLAIDHRGITRVHFGKGLRSSVIDTEVPIDALPSPDGKRIFASYPDTPRQETKGTTANTANPQTQLVTMKLPPREHTRTHKTVRRNVALNARAIVWSRDSHWVLVQEAQKTCIAAAVGGQYKCFHGYRGITLSPKGRYALVVSRTAGPSQAGYQLLRADLHGAKVKKPHSGLKASTDMAIWLKRDVVSLSTK